MKYIYYILAIIAISTFGIAYTVHEESPDKGEYAIIVRDKVISFKEFKKSYDQKKGYIDKDEFINSIIMHELLIQEAQEIGIDKEESFRRSIERYYKQSLTKILLDRKFDELVINVSEEEIDRYLNLCGREVAITLTSYSGVDNKTNAKSVIVDNFDDLSSEIKVNLLPISPGEYVKIQIGQNNVLDLHLDSVSVKVDPSVVVIQRDEAAKIISEYKREQAMNVWMDGLRNNSYVKINNSKIL